MTIIPMSDRLISIIITGKIFFTVGIYKPKDNEFFIYQASAKVTGDAQQSYLSALIVAILTEV
jgi:hypothetical protein